MTVQKIIGVLSRSIFTLAMLAGTYSVSSANQQALDWLQTQQGIAGDFSTQTLTSSAFQASAEVVAAWNLTGQVINPATVDFISAESYSSTEYLSLKIASHQSAGRDISGLTQQLLALQNADGGFGELAGYDSTSLDTAMAIIALSYADVSIQTVVSEAISYLLRNQQTDGGFPLKYPNDSAVYVSSLVSMALQKYMFSYDLSAAIDLTNTFILEQQLSTGGWQSTWETAIAIKAIAPVSTDVFNISSAIQRLQGDQLENGSWSNDVYTTALAIQADYLISQFQPPVGETVSGVTGKILDANSNIQIAGATVSLQENPSSMTQSVSDGVFRLQDFLPGQYTLVIEKPGYLPFTSSISTQGGQWLSLGVVHLSPASTTGFMTGFVSDAQTGLRIPGAQLSFSGSTSGNLLTDMSGSYDTVLTPGDVTVTVSATGYDLVVGSISVTPGSSINFSPALFATGTTPSTQTVTLRGLVIDAESGAVLPGVQIAVNQTDTAQSMDAPFEITDIPAGTIDVDLSLNGYVPAHYSTFSSAGGVLDLGIIRMERSADTSTSVVSGQVVDAADGMPVANAEVTLHGAPASVITDAAGYYLFNDVPGIEFSLAASAVGYQVASTSISVPAPGPVNYTIRLSRAAPADFDIVNVHTYQQQYEALSEVEVDAILSNTGTEDRNIILFNKVVNASNEVIGQFPSRYLPIGADVMDTMVVVTAGNLLETELEWDSARHQPGVYTLIIQAYDAYTSSLLAERPTQIEILPTRKIAGTGEFDPPVAQLAARKAIDIRANVVNRGNQPIDASTITARVQLNNQGYDVTNNPTEITVAASGQGMSAPKGIDVDVSGNIYVANSGAGSVSRISPEGIVSLFAEGL